MLTTMTMVHKLTMHDDATRDHHTEGRDHHTEGRPKGNLVGLSTEDTMNWDAKDNKKSELMLMGHSLMPSFEGKLLTQRHQNYLIRN